MKESMYDKKSKIVSSVTIPRFAKVIKGDWISSGYGGVWCKIRSIELDGCKEMDLHHPKLGEFAWVCIKDCIFKY